MFREQNPYVRALYIVLVPIVLLILVLNSGWLQRILPAASIDGELYSVVDYDYYYFDYYNRFLEENSDQLEELGYDSSISNGQQNYNDTITWREYFLQEGEKELASAKFFYDLAVADGYEFSDEELLPIQEQVAKNEEIKSTYSLKGNNFYISYYGRGMNEKSYMKQLEISVKAKAYRQHLIDSYEASEEQIQDYLADQTEPDYHTVSLSVITLDAQTIRGEESGDASSISALKEKLNRLKERHEEGESFEDLQAAFSSLKLGDSNGLLEDATRTNLPDVISDLVTYNQESIKKGDTYALLDEDAGIAYFIRIDGLGDSGLEKEATLDLGEEAVNQQFNDTFYEQYQVKRNSIGIMLSAN